MGALAGWPDCQTNLMQRAATTADAPGDGQPGWTPDGVLCGVAVRTRDYAAVHTAERIVVEHDRVHPAHCGRACVSGADPSQLGGVNRMAWGDRPRMEWPPDPIRMAAQTSTS